MENSTTFTRNWRITIGTLAMALAIVIAAVPARPARAYKHVHYAHHPRRHAQPYYRHRPKHHRGVIYAPAPNVYYAPPPVVYAPPPPPGGSTFIFPFGIH